MPIAPDLLTVDPLSVDVRPSVAAELYWALFIGPPGADDAFPIRAARFVGHPALAQRISEFWGDGLADYIEVLPLAGRAGRLFGDAHQGLVPALVAAATDPPPASILVSETEQDRARVARRFDRLATDEQLRRRWGQLLGDVWAILEPGWEAEGRDVVSGAVRGRSRATRRATTAAEVVALAGDADGEMLRRMAQWAASAHAPISMIPSWMCRRSFILTVEEGLLVGIPADGVGLRARTEVLARRLKAMADPARLTVLEKLAVRPRTIGELTADVGLAQATVSAHVKLLRQAALVTPDPTGGRRLVVDAGAIAELLGETAGLLGLASQR